MRISIHMQTKIVLLIIIFLGIGLRFFLASLNQYNFDIVQYQRDVEILNAGGNVYALQKNYNYSPFWFLTLWGLSLAPVLNALPFYFVVRAFLSVIDLVILFVILKIAKQRNLNPLKTGALFFLNPVSIIISGYHGQFDNIAILFVLIAIYLHGKPFVGLSRTKIVLVWMATTTALIIKHIVLFPVTFFWFNITKKWKAIVALAASIIVFLTTFLPYAEPGAKYNMLKNVFLYRSVEGRYGIGEILNIRCSGKCVIQEIPVGPVLVTVDAHLIYFILFLGCYGLILFFIKFKDPARAALFSILYFLTFTNGIGAQYFSIPIALGALFPTKWFLLFSASTALFMIGNSDELAIPAFSGFGWMIPWLFIGLWFLSEFLNISPLARKIYNRIVL